jgi:hypothetical protein
LGFSPSLGKPLLNEIVGKLSTGSEVINGTDLDDYIRPLGGSDFIDGKKGFDTVYVFWPASKFKLTTTQGTTYLDAVSGASRSDKLVLRNVEAVEFSDKVVSLEIADVYANTAGSDTFDGGPGVDTVVYNGVKSSYVIKPEAAGISVRSATYSEGSDWLLNVERLQFNDVKLAFDLDGHAGVAVKTLGLVFGAAAASVPAYVGICLDRLENQRQTKEQLMHDALAIRLGVDAQSAEQVVSFLYQSLVGVVPTKPVQDFYVSWIQSGAYTVDSLAVYASELSLNAVSAQLTGMAATGVAYEMPL